jgi:hypothetical protein
MRKRLGCEDGGMFLKREVRRKDGKEHVYYSLAETTRIGRERVVQRRLLNLGELNTTQIRFTSRNGKNRMLVRREIGKE